MENATSRGLFAPEGTPQERIDIIADAYEKALQNEELIARIENEFGSVPRFLAGEEYREFLVKNEERLAEAANDIDFDS